ncbi:MAG: hypothetical protein Q7Q73_19830, partial [Verrucomicrobiota bacterium JB024]|nr:hypothetical protein [Verrucomicrobiota bacterium JB024]
FFEYGGIQSVENTQNLAMMFVIKHLLAAKTPWPRQVYGQKLSLDLPDRPALPGIPSRVHTG